MSLPDSIDLLDYGLNRKILDDGAYAQELAIGLPARAGGPCHGT